MKERFLKFNPTEPGFLQLLKSIFKDRSKLFTNLMRLLQSIYFITRDQHSFKFNEQ